MSDIHAETEQSDSLRVIGPEYGEGTRQWVMETARIVASGSSAPQRQDGLDVQLRDLEIIANRFGLYDASDYLRVRREGYRS